MDRTQKTLAFAAFADVTRQQIIELLGVHGELCVNDLVDAIRCPQPTVSKGLTILRFAKVVDKRKVGTHCYYSLNDETISEMRRYVAELQLLALVDPDAVVRANQAALASRH